MPRANTSLIMISSTPYVLPGRPGTYWRRLKGNLRAALRLRFASPVGALPSNSHRRCRIPGRNFTSQKRIARHLTHQIGNHRSTKTNVAIVKDQILAWRRRPLRGIEDRAPAPVSECLQSASCLGHAIARLGGEHAMRRWRRSRDPMHGLEVDRNRIEARIVVTLYDHERIAREILRGNEPRRVASARRPAHAESLALSERVVGEPVMSADNLAFGRFDRPGLARQIAGQKIAERALADEADACRVLLGEGRNTLLARDRPYVALGQLAERKHRGSELFLRELVQEVGLVLARVDRPQQLHAIAVVAKSRVVTRGDGFGAERARVIEKRLELDLVVAKDVGIGRSSGAI